MRTFRQVSSAAVIALAVTAAATLGSAAPALAAPGDASARGVVVTLSADVAGTAVVTANATIGTAVAPPGGGTDTDTGLDVSLAGAVGASAGGTARFRRVRSRSPRTGSR